MSDNESQAMKIVRQSANAFVAIIVAIIACVIYFNMPDPRWLQAIYKVSKNVYKVSKNATKLVATSVRWAAANIGIYRTIQIIIAVVSGCFLIINAWALSATLSVWWYTISSLTAIIGYGLALLVASLTLLQFRAIKLSGIQEVTQTGRETVRNALSAQNAIRALP